MQERATAAGAMLSIQSHPQSGTEVTLVWRSGSEGSGLGAEETASR
jgi:nitrate/nitrite-specific signal transduction histidine kinase